MASVGGEMLMRTATQSLSASGSVVLAVTVAPSTVPPAQSASTVVLPAVGELMVTWNCPNASVRPENGPTKSAVAPSVLAVIVAVTVSSANGIHTSCSTDFSSKIVSTWSVPTSLASVSGAMLMRTSTPR